MSKLMEKFATAARSKKKYRMVSEQTTSESTSEKSSLVPSLLNLLHRDILEEDCESAMENIQRLTKALCQEQNVNFEVDEIDRQSARIPESIYESHN